MAFSSLTCIGYVRTLFLFSLLATVSFVAGALFGADPFPVIYKGAIILIFGFFSAFFLDKGRSVWEGVVGTAGFSLSLGMLIGMILPYFGGPLVLLGILFEGIVLGSLAIIFLGLPRPFFADSSWHVYLVGTVVFSLFLQVRSITTLPVGFPGAGEIPLLSVFLLFLTTLLILHQWRKGLEVHIFSLEEACWWGSWPVSLVASATVAIIEFMPGDAESEN